MNPLQRTTDEDLATFKMQLLSALIAAKAEDKDLDDLILDVWRSIKRDKQIGKRESAA